VNEFCIPEKATSPGDRGVSKPDQEKKLFSLSKPTSKTTMVFP
jgi:hypothetical protein